MDELPELPPPIDTTAQDIVRNAARLAALRRTALLDSPAEAAFDRLTRLATRILDAPTALVSLVDENRQFFKSCIGLPEPWASRRETPLSHSFCQHTIATAEPLVIGDARMHPLVSTNLAIPDLNVVAYAGIPLVTADGQALGSFCVIDSQPRDWTTDEVEILNELAASVVAEIELRSATREAQHQAEIQHFLAQVSRVLVDSFDAETSLQSVARLAVPLLADGCVIDIIEEDGSRRRVAATALDAPTEALIAELLQYSSLHDMPRPLAEATRTGQARLIPAAADDRSTGATQHSEYLRVAHALNLQSGWVIPMVAREHTVGVITLISTHADYPYAGYDLIVAQDLAQRAALAVDNARLYQVARQAIQARDEMLAMVSHDFRTPLGVVKGFTHLLQRRVQASTMPDKETLGDMFTKIDSAIQRMVYLLDELVEVTHLQAGQKLALPHEPTDLVRLVRRAADEQQESARRHRLHVQSELPELIGLYDVVRVERALINLLTNAIKYSPAGGEIHITVAAESDTSGTWATIRVQDQGIGIPAADLPRIFQRFYRAGNVGSIRGTGIGLATVEWIVTQHGGTVTLESTEGVGTTVVLRLPHMPYDGDDLTWDR
ncbi:MAG TPA: GAF domain-containing sensor histidine kinase [Herpetosiphonaceae bacterium]